VNVTLYDAAASKDAAIRLAAIALAACLLSSCRSKSSEQAAGAPAPTASTSAPKTPDNLAPGAARALAFADPSDAEPVDHLIRAEQKKAKAIESSTDHLIVLGRFWIRKARETSQPRYYLNARAAGDLVIEREPSNRLARNLHATALLNEHRFQEAADLARSVLAKDAEDLEALGTLADAELELGHYDEATKLVDRLNDLKPSLPTYARTAHLQWLRGDTKASLESYRLAMAAGNDPTHPEPRCWAMAQAAYVFFHRGDYAGADAGFELALRECTNFVPALVGAGRAAQARGDLKRALSLLEKAFAKAATPETAWRLGDARLSAGDRAGAERAYDHVTRSAADEDPRTVAQFLATKGREPKRAVELARAEMVRRPGVHTIDTLAWALHRAGKTEEAERHTAQALRLGTPDPTLLYHAGAIRIARGKAAEGYRLVERALELSPRFDPIEADAARALLAARERTTAAAR
jgi:tetratricopeptide (TPR) repeat protein